MVTITHPFHPGLGKQFEVIAVQHCWGEPRVSYRGENGTSRSAPVSWTNLALPDMFLEVSAGRSIVHPKDLRSLLQLVRSMATPHGVEEEPEDGPMDV